MAIVAERLFVMTNLTIRCVSARLDPVGEPVVNVVDSLTFQRLRFIVSHGSGRDHAGLFCGGQRR